MEEEATPKPAKAIENNNLNLSWRDGRYHRFYEVVDQLVREVQEHVWVKTGQPKRRLRGDGLAKLHYSVECLVRDCVAVVLHRKRKGEASIRLGQYYYDLNRPDQMLTYSIHIQRAFQGLKELGYLTITKEGFHDRIGRKDGTATSRLTRYIAADHLLALFSDRELKVLPVLVPQYEQPELIKVRVKQKDGDGIRRKLSVPVQETVDTQVMRSNLRLINKAQSRYWYDLEISNDELTSLQQRLADDPKDERIIRLDQRSLHRVFNDPELQTGGRFYGGWWQNIPREYRRHLAVNGKQMVELDYSNQHPSILYAQEGITRPTDCYSKVIKLSQLPNGVTISELRDTVKAAFNAMLNSPKVLKNAPTGIEPKRFGLKWRDISEAITTFHKPIAHHFYSGVGLRLQRMDSDIAEKVMVHFAKYNIAILPLHDSFLIHHGYEHELRDEMDKAFKDVVGISPKVDRKEEKKVNEMTGMETDDDFGEPVTSDIYELLASLDGHDHRLNEFFSLQNKRKSASS